MILKIKYFPFKKVRVLKRFLKILNFIRKTIASPLQNSHQAIYKKMLAQKLAALNKHRLITLIITVLHLSKF